MADTDVLWGGSLTWLSVDLSLAELRAGIRVSASGVASDYVLIMEGVSSASIDRADLLPWGYTEVTEVHVNEGTAGCQVEPVLWEEPNGLSVRCSTVRVEAART